MSSNIGTVTAFEPVEDPAAQRNFDQLTRLTLGSGPAQARVFNSANIATVNNTPLILTFNTERWDTGNFHSTSVNTSRMTAPIAGLYSIGAGIQWAASAVGIRQIGLLLNATSFIAVREQDPASAGLTAMGIDTEWQLAAGDYVEVRVLQTSGGALNVAAATDYSPEFWIHRIGGQA